ncbi:MAG: cytochrome P450 [Polyangia bacterium]|jgi:cytochrome P450/NADPH-cytochrome P450 reductase
MSKRAEVASIPQPPVRLIIGNAPDIDPEVPLQSMMRLAQELGPIFRLTFPKHSLLALSGHSLVAEVCDESRFEKTTKGALDVLRDLGGDGLFTARNDEPNWGKAHRLLMPAFSPSAMRDYFDDMVDIADQMLTKWERLGPEVSLDVSDNMTRLTLDTIALCGFGYRFNSYYQNEMHPFVDSMVRALREAGRRSRRLPIQNRLMLSTTRQYESDIEYLHSVTAELIKKRRKLAKEETPTDLLSRMLNARDPLTGETLDDDNIRNQLVTFLIAGHETTSGLLSFATYLLLQNPDVMARAQAEVDRVLGDGPARYEHIAQLVFIDQILRETLRLYPTAPAFTVTPKVDTLLHGRYPLRKGDICIVLLPSLHRDPEVWKQPERFDPDRFAPDAIDKIPAKAWMPFGNGQRSCIGRAFSLQESTLVLASVLQRFEIWQPSSYQLKIKESLTLKPEGLTIRARVRKHVARPLASRPVSRPVQTSSSPEPASAHGVPLLLLYGSNSGASEAFARRIASDGNARGYTTKVAPLDDYAGKLPKEGVVLIVTSSYNGQPPDNARKFCLWLQAVPAASLLGVRYAVFGCGNRDWATTYQAVPQLIDQNLSRAGANAVVTRGEADARADFFGDFEHWYGTLWESLGTALGVDSQQIEVGPLYRVQVVPSASADLVKQNALGMATVVENRELVDLSSPYGRSKRHLTIALSAGVTYAAGDYLAVLPENDPALIERAARRFSVRPDAAVVLQSTRGAMSASLPTDRPISIQELLGRHVELSAPATKKDVERLAARNVCPPHRVHLAALAADSEAYRTEILEKRVSVLDLIERYPSCELSLGEFLEMLPAMRVRQYSISSSPRVDPSQCTLTVAVLRAPAWSGNGHFRGTCSSYLARLNPGDSVAVAVRTPNAPFHPPASNQTPMVMICAGTGLAPFRGFLQERALRKASGEQTGEALLFFGCDHPDVDFLYKDELMAWEREGVVTLLPAFTFQPDGDVQFVQHRLWKERARVTALLQQGAIVFLCGEGQKMAPAVRQTLAQIHQEATHCSDAEAKDFVDAQEREGRFVSDVFT